MKKIILMLSLSLLCVVTLRPTDGTLDTSFGNGAGYVTLPLGFFASCVAVQPDGRIVAAGSDTANNFQLVRYNTNGSLDLSFGEFSNGIGVGPAGLLFDLFIGPDGYIVVGGQDMNGNFQIAQYYPEGFINSDFGDNGIVNVPSGFCSALAQQENLYILAAGADDSGDFLVVRYDNFGNIDTTFAVAPLGYIEDLIIQPNGKAVVCGVDNSGNFSIVRYNTDGSIDTTFGILGIVTGPAGVATSLVLQPNGSIVVAGFDLSSPNNMQLIRIDSSGNLDTSFGTLGVVTGPVGIINGIALQADGNIVAVGENSTETLIVRFASSGGLDSSFGTSGIATGQAGSFNGVAFQESGNIVVAGLDSAYSNFLIALYTSTQTITPTQISSPVAAATGSVTINGTAQNPSDVFIYIDGTFVGATPTTGSSNTWSYTNSFAEQGVSSVRAVSVYKDANLVNAGSELIRIYG